MKLDLGSLMFNATISSGSGTPSWGTALGQNQDYKFDFNNMEEFLTSMMYNKVNDSEVECPLGKGGSSENYEVVISSLFNKIYVNGNFINNSKYVLLIVKEFTQSHPGRKSLKYNPKIKYKGVNINEQCIKNIIKSLQLKDESSWIVTDIFTKNQDELHFEVTILDRENGLQFNNVTERKNYIISVLNKKNSDKTMTSVEYWADKVNELKKTIPSPWDVYRFLGFKYGEQIDDNNLLKEVIKKCGDKESVITEIQKTIMLSKIVKNQKEGLFENCDDLSLKTYDDNTAINSKYWFYQANPTLFDHALCFNENGFIDWHQNGRKHEVGDIVFVYISETEKKIRYRARVVKTNMTFEEKIDDSKYWTNYSEDRESKYVRIELIDECDSELLSLDNLIKHGYKVGPIQPFCLNEKYSGLVNYINSVFDGDFDKQPVYDYSSKLAEGKNLVIYGTPGCGKSYYVEHKELKDYPKEGKDFSTVIRTTFYQDYTNTDFIGQLLPKVDANKDVTYEFNPGPFTIALKTAIQNPDKPVALVIEELNRGNAASIFGDIFQLLDRSENGASEYKIHNVNIQDYLNKEVEGKGVFDYIKIPGNLSIIATMNTSDQNVFTLDTAFKRRWEFEKLPNKFNKGHEHAKYMVPGMPGCNWYALANAINDYIVEKQNSLISEDKQIGIFFVKDTMLINPKTEIDDGSKTKKFAYKMIEYLWNDVAKHNNRSEWFNGAKTLDEALEQYENPKKQAFNDELMKKINEYMDKYKNEFENDLATKEEDNNVQ